MFEEFKKVSEQKKQRRQLNKYPYRLSRKGYARLDEEIAAELCDDEEINRVTLWRKGVTKKNGVIEGELLKETITKIDTYVQQKKEGLLKHKGDKEDILTLALGSAEHAGRVRAVGGHINPTTYFGVLREKKTIDRDLYLAQQAKFESRISKLEATMKQKCGSSEYEIEEKGSCMYHRSEHEIQPLYKGTSNDDNEDLDMNLKDKKQGGNKSSGPNNDTSNNEDGDVRLINKEDTFEGKRVALRLESENVVVVVYGTVVSASKLLWDPLHISSMDCMCVSIDQALQINVVLPFPISSSCQTIGDAVGSHVDWPVKFIKLQDEVQLKDKKQGRNKLKHKESMIQLDKSVPKSLRLLYKYYNCFCRGGEGINISVDHHLFGNSLPQPNLNVFVQDVLEVCQLNPVSCTTIAVYQWCLHEKMKAENKLNKFRFMHPYNAGHLPTQRTDKEYQDQQLETKAIALAAILGEIFPDEILLVPCNVGWHWILTVIDMQKEIVYLLDPFGARLLSDDWKYVVDTAMKKLNHKNGKSLRSKTDW